MENALILAITTYFLLLFSCQITLIAEMEELSQTTTVAGDFPDHLKPIAEKSEMKIRALNLFI